MRNLKRGIALALALFAAAAPHLLPTQATAFSSDDLARFNKERKCIGCDLRGADFKGQDLRAAMLEGALLIGANLQGANLEDAFMEDCSLEDANLAGANLNGAGLDGATWVDGRTCGQDSVGACK